MVPISDESIAAIRAALEAAGVIFVAENGEGPGVRLRKGIYATEPGTSGGCPNKRRDRE